MNDHSTQQTVRRSRLARWIVCRVRSRSRGQALVEFAMFVPLLMFMVTGATDVSTLINDHLDVVYAARAGARVGSVIGNYSPTAAPYTADCAIIGAVQAALSGSRDIQISQIAIYQAPLNGVYSSTADQDVYPGNAVCNADGSITPSASKTGWPPGGGNGGNPPPRSTTPFQEDSVGVAISYTYTYQFPLLGVTSFSSTDYAVMPIEIVVGTPVAQPTVTPK